MPKTADSKCSKRKKKTDAPSTNASAWLSRYRQRFGTTAYLDLGTQGAAALEIDFGGETTGLTNLNVATEKASPVFDLSGRRVTNVQKGGLYIQNGKKFIVK